MILRRKRNLGPNPEQVQGVSELRHRSVRREEFDRHFGRVGVFIVDKCNIVKEKQGKEPTNLPAVYEIFTPAWRRVRFNNLDSREVIYGGSNDGKPIPTEHADERTRRDAESDRRTRSPRTLRSSGTLRSVLVQRGASGPDSGCSGSLPVRASLDRRVFLPLLVALKFVA